MKDFTACIYDGNDDLVVHLRAKDAANALDMLRVIDFAIIHALFDGKFDNLASDVDTWDYSDLVES